MKGVSPLIASGLLIEITITLATMIWTSISSTVKLSTATSENKTAQSVECSSASISIDDVVIVGPSSASTVSVIVRNSGYMDNLALQDAEVYNKTGSNFTSSSVPLNHFNRGSIATLTFSNVSFSSLSCPSGFAKVIVTTNCGGISNVFDGTPKCS